MQRFLVFLCLFILKVSLSHAAVGDIIINFDTDPSGAEIPAGTNLKNEGTYSSWGVTFTRIGGSSCGPDVYANSNHPGDFGSLPNVVSTCQQGYASDMNGPFQGRIRANFAETASKVCIDVLPVEAKYNANMTAFTTDDTIVDSQNSTPGVNETLCVNGSGISYVMFPGTGNSTIEYARFDNLVITPGSPTSVKPIPTLSEWALILLSMLLGVVVFARAGRQQA